MLRRASRPETLGFLNLIPSVIKERALSSCRPPPPEDLRRDLIGAWHPPRVTFVRRRSASSVVNQTTKRRDADTTARRLRDDDSDVGFRAGDGATRCRGDASPRDTGSRCPDATQPARPRPFRLTHSTAAGTRSSPAASGATGLPAAGSGGRAGSGPGTRVGMRAAPRCRGPRASSGLRCWPER